MLILPVRSQASQSRVTEQGRIPKDVAAELGFSVRSWLKNAGVSLSRSNKDTKRIRELEAQNRELRKQVKDGVIDVLKKVSRHTFKTLEDKYN